MLKKDNNASNNFQFYKNKDYILNNKKQNIKEDYINLIDKKLKIKRKNNLLLKYIFENGFFAN